MLLEVKMYSILLIISKIQIKATARYCLTADEIATTKSIRGKEAIAGGWWEAMSLQSF